MRDPVYWGVVLSAVAVFITLLWVRAPYGRHAGKSWGPQMDTRAAWIIMESPATLAFLYFYLQGEQAGELVPLVFLCMWQVHYVHRGFIYPLRMRSSKVKRTPIVIPAMALVFNVANAYLNGGWIASEEADYGPSWLWSAPFIVGSALFAAGFLINRWADAKLRVLRKPGESGYSIPKGGLYEYISSPNYFGEILQWIGWAIATWSAAGFAFALFTTANLLPRALSHHRWYHEKFSDYPKRRRALIPTLL
jgi:protein-S-isoprenylcysteine O-methyltransferase Ste14